MVSPMAPLAHRQVPPGGTCWQCRSDRSVPLLLLEWFFLLAGRRGGWHCRCWCRPASTVESQVRARSRLWSLLVLARGACSGVCFGIRRYVAFRNARLIEARLRDRLFAHIQRLHFSFHDANATGDLMSRANTDLQHFQNVIT